MSEDQALFIGRTGQAHPLTTNERALSDEIDARDRIIEQLQASEARLVDAAIEADGCFEAALHEGWAEAMADGDIERIRELWGRRISHARNSLIAALSNPRLFAAAKGQAS